jgi:F-type H+-transporting ATPase subunit a
VVSWLAARRVAAAVRADKAPHGALSNAIEAMVVFVRDEVVVPMGGHHLGHYTPLFITYFFLILTCNFLGMLPDFGSSTGNISVTIALGGSVYLLIWLLGLKNQGLRYLVHLVPPGTPLLLWPFMFILELLGPVIKCGVLCVRLFANMIAGHLIIGSIINLGVITPLMLLIGLPLCLGLSFLEVLVCIIQAYVFTLLAAIFIGAAVHPEH